MLFRYLGDIQCEHVAVYFQNFMGSVSRLYLLPISGKAKNVACSYIHTAW